MWKVKGEGAKVSCTKRDGNRVIKRASVRKKKEVIKGYMGSRWMGR